MKNKQISYTKIDRLALNLYKFNKRNLVPLLKKFLFNDNNVALFSHVLPKNKFNRYNNLIKIKKKIQINYLIKLIILHLYLDPQSMGSKLLDNIVISTNSGILLEQNNKRNIQMKFKSNPIYLEKTSGIPSFKNFINLIRNFKKSCRMLRGTKVFSADRKGIKKLNYIKAKITKNNKIPQMLLHRYKHNKFFKSRPVLPWILQGRKQHLKLKYTLWFLYYQLVNNKYSILSKQDENLIKKFKRTKKFSKFGRYGTQSKHNPHKNKFNNFKSNKVNKKIIKKLPIQRQHIYLQYKRLSVINNPDFFFYKYIYILIVIWHLLMNSFLTKQRVMFVNQIWLSFFLKNLWIYSCNYPTNNLYLTYGMVTSIVSTPQNVNLYVVNRNKLDYELNPLKNYGRLIIGIYNNKKLTSARTILRQKRRSKVRTFFRISPKLRMKNVFIKNNKNKRKNKTPKILSPKEWLLVNKFTRRKYQDVFPVIFSQWKNVKKIKKYVGKQSQGWHQPYLITNPCYYTSRYKTFVYETFGQ